MAAMISRYRKSQEISATDAAGRTLVSKELRFLPVVTGTFLHTVEETDRLDNLSFKYYKQPRKWWRICDANPEPLCPLALLGKEPIVTTLFPLSIGGNEEQLRWPGLIKTLVERPGVLDIKISEDMRFVPGSVFTITEESLESLRSKEVPEDLLIELRSKLMHTHNVGEEKFLSALKTAIGESRTDEFKSLILECAAMRKLDGSGRFVSVLTERFERLVLVTHNQMNINAEDLASVMQSEGFEPGQPIRVARIGKNIVIPPDVVV